jgi:predicted NBD/HSP70 family sugar kinase
MAYLGVGTGIGAGVILQGRLYHGTHGMAGGIGHMIWSQTARCQCGAQGCLEALAAGPAIARLAQRAIASGQGRLRDYSPLTAEAFTRPRSRRCSGTSRRRCRRAPVRASAASIGDDLRRGNRVRRRRRAQAMRSWADLRELERQRQQSALAREMRLDMFKLLPPNCDAGAWGAVAIAEHSLRDD